MYESPDDWTFSKSSKRLASKALAILGDPDDLGLPRHRRPATKRSVTTAVVDPEVRRMPAADATPDPVAP